MGTEPLKMIWYRYFNTVGSKEGWTPSTFVSSRQNRAKDTKQQKIEDFMDEEDIREAEESKQLETSEDFAGLGGGQSQVMGRRGIVDLLKTEGETIGVKLLKRMGWREGQGIGPKVRRRANLDDSSNLTQDAITNLKPIYSPCNTRRWSPLCEKLIILVWDSKKKERLTPICG